MMRLSLTFAIALAAAVPVLAADVGVSITLGQPGFYGRIDIGDYPEPTLIYRNPYVIERVSARRPPIYLHVPPGHARNWRKHCRTYNACNERVYFVQDSWYNNEYVPRYQERNHPRRDDRDDGRGHDRRDDRGDDRRDGRGDDRRGSDNGRGHNDRGQGPNQ